MEETQRNTAKPALSQGEWQTLSELIARAAATPAADAPGLLEFGPGLLVLRDLQRQVLDARIAALLRAHLVVRFTSTAEAAERSGSPYRATLQISGPGGEALTLSIPLEAGGPISGAARRCARQWLRFEAFDAEDRPGLGLMTDPPEVAALGELCDLLVDRQRLTAEPELRISPLPVQSASPRAAGTRIEIQPP